jgi:7-cyano-7-deazaguanine synthase
MNKKKEIAVISLSGGLDSCVTAAVAVTEYEPAFLHINYGQRTQARELKAFSDIADYYEVKKRLIVDYLHFSRIGGSSLTDNKLNIPEADLNSREIPVTYVPFRNANILSAAFSWGEVIGAKAVFMGAVYEDATGYPDCRPEFFEAFEKMADLGTRPDTRIKILTPVIHLSKKQIIEKGVELEAPLHFTWSCYQEEDKACGICDSCALRLRGFRQAGIEDPLNYKIRPVYD